MAQNIEIEIRPTSSEMEYTIEDLESNTQYNLEVIVFKSWTPFCFAELIVPRYSYQHFVIWYRTTAWKLCLIIEPFKQTSF